MTIYRLFDGVTPAGGPAADDGQYTMGTAFILSEAAALTGVWFYSAPGTTVLPTWAGIWRVSDQAEVIHHSTADGTLVWSGPAGSGWVKASFDGSVTLSAGVYYKVTVFHPGGSFWYTLAAHYFDPATPGVTSGILHAPPSIFGVVDNGTFAGAQGWVYPVGSFNNSCYWIDVEVTVGAAPSSGEVTSGDVTLFGHTFPAGSAIAGFSTRVQHYLRERGLIGGPNYTVVRPFHDLGVMLTPGTPWIATGRSPATVRRLLRGRYIR